MKQSLVLAGGVLLLAASLASADAGRKGRTDVAAAPVAKETPATRETRLLPRNDDFRAGGMRIAALLGTSPSGCPNPGANPVTSNASSDVSVGGVFCGPASGPSGPATFARVFNQSQIGTAYSINCVNFGAFNSGSPLTATVGLWRDPTGGSPSIAEVQLIASYEVLIPTGFEQLLSVSGDPICVEIGANETLVVTLDLPPSPNGICTYAGGLDASSPTYTLAAQCNLPDFVDLGPAGFPEQWYVELSGDFGCSDDILGDLNNDGLVNGTDLAILLGAWGSADPIADLSGDGEVGGADLSILLGNWTA